MSELKGPSKITLGVKRKDILRAKSTNACQWQYGMSAVCLRCPIAMTMCSTCRRQRYLRKRQSKDCPLSRGIRGPKQAGAQRTD